MHPCLIGEKMSAVGQGSETANDQKHRDQSETGSG